MAYLGQSNALYDPTRVTPTTVQTFNGNGVTTQFNLTYPVTNSADIEVLVENVVQQPDYAYTAIGNVITFTSAPPVGTNNIYVRFGKVTGLTGTVPDGSVTSSKLANNIRLLATDMYTGTGSQSTFNLSDTPADANSLIVSVNGIEQAAPRNYTVSGSTITFTSAPDAGANVVIRNVGFRTTQTLYAFPSGTQMVQPVITGGSANNLTLTSSTLINPVINGFTGDTSVVNIGSGQFYKDASGNIGIGTSSPSYKLQVAGYSNANSSNKLAIGGIADYQALLYMETASETFTIENTSDYPSSAIIFRTNAAERLRLDSSGNLGLGVTPSSTTNWLNLFVSKAVIQGRNADGSVVLGSNQTGAGAYYTSNYALYYYQNSGNGTHAWYNAPSGTAGNAISFTQAMTLDASGNLLVGTTSYPGRADANANVNGAVALAGKNEIRWYGTNASIYGGSGGADDNLYYYSGLSHIWRSGSTERARIDSSGNLLVGTTSASSGYGLKVANGGLLVNSSQGGNNLVVFENTSTSGYGISVNCNNSNTTYRYFEGFSSSASAQKIAIFTDGNVRIAAGSTYGNLSDASLKTDITDASTKLSDVCALRVRNFATLEDPNNKYIGFIAQEFENVFPSLVTTSTDVYKDGREIKGIKESALIPILVKAIQELSAKVDAQQAEIDKLKGTN